MPILSFVLMGSESGQGILPVTLPFIAYLLNSLLLIVMALINKKEMKKDNGKKIYDRIAMALTLLAIFAPIMFVALVSLNGSLA